MIESGSESESPQKLTFLKSSRVIQRSHAGSLKELDTPKFNGCGKDTHIKAPYQFN